jgi:broad specificity phosphatase PhoE
MLPLRRLEIRRHALKGTDLGGDCLSPEGVEQAHHLGRTLRVGFTHLFTSGAQRATQTLACILAGMGRPVLSGVVVGPGLASRREAEWREAARVAGSAALTDLLKDHGTLVREESERLAAELRTLLGTLPEGGYALAIGHTPLIECGIYGLSGKAPDPLNELEGFLLTEHKGGRLEFTKL